MSSNGSQEIDLSVLWSKFLFLFDSLGLLIYRFILFIRRNIFILLGLIILGAVAGYFLDKKSGEKYKHQIIVVPNFDSVNYYYNKIEGLKLEEGSAIISVQIEPIIDVYQFMSSHGHNIKIAEFLSENNIKFYEFKKGSQAEKIYKYHLITLITNKKDTTGSIVDSFLEGLNEESYYIERQKIEQENVEQKIRESSKTIEKVNAILDRSGQSSTSARSELNIELNSQLNDLLNSKQQLVENVSALKIIQVEQRKILYEVSKFTNVKIKSMSNMVILPSVLLLVFFGFVILQRVYNRYKLIV